MTAARALPDGRGRLARAARPALWVLMPVLSVIDQYCAERLARSLGAAPVTGAWLLAVIRSPWLHAWIGFEVVTLATWMVVLAELSLSAAFPMTAAGYVLVIGMGWTVLGEPVSWLQVLGGAAILGGAWLLGQDEGAA